MTAPSPRSRLPAAEGFAWVGFLRAHDLICQKLDADLRASADFGLNEFEVLLHLASAGGEKRMAQIASDVVLTGGGATRIVARLEKLGLITRRSCPNDGRGVFAVLTQAGWAAQRSAHKVHIESVQRLFLREATTQEIAVLATFFGRIVTRERGKAVAADEPCALSDAEGQAKIKTSPTGRRRQA